MIMQNAADAAVALAEYVAGTRATFVDMMNQRVKQEGCTSTEFTDVRCRFRQPDHPPAGYGPHDDGLQRQSPR